MAKGNFENITPVIPFDCGDLYQKERKKGEYVVLELKTNPNSTSTSTFKINAFILRDHMGVEEFIVWQQQLQKIIEKQPIKAVSDKVAMVQQLLEGDRLVAFESALAVAKMERQQEADEKNRRDSKKTATATTTSTSGESKDEEKEKESDKKKGAKAIATLKEVDFKNMLQTVANHVFPQQALRFQRRYMRQSLRKPKTTTARAFVARMTQMNTYLEYFPPFKSGQVLSSEDFMELLEASIPNSWRKEFRRTGYDPADHDLITFVERCERVEFHEGIDDTKFNSNKSSNGPRANTESSTSGKPGAKSHAKSSREANNKSKNNNNKNSRSTEWCALHECFGHSTADCNNVKAQIALMKKAWQNKSAEAKIAEKNNNKKRAFDLQAIVEDAVAKAINKKPGRNGKKRYAEANIVEEVTAAMEESESEDSST